MLIDSLDDAVQLHEHVEIHYLVDHYQAVLWTLDARRPVLAASGSTINDAMAALTALVKGMTLDDVRCLPPLEED